MRPESLRRLLRLRPGLPAKILLALVALIATPAGSPAEEAPSWEFPRGAYFGQAPPGTKPSVFAPGLVSLENRYEYVIAFSPDGTESCFGVTDSEWSTCDLYCSRQEEGVWTEPALAPFQKGGDGWLPSFSPDGKRLLFSSGRPDLKSSNSYVCERTAGGWGPAVKMGPPVNSSTYDWRPQITASGTLYFTSNRSGGQGDMDIYRSVSAAGEFREVENLGPPISSPHLDASPCLSLDERFMVIESWRPGGNGQGDLYISYRRGDGTWSDPQNLGPEINTDQIDDGGSISPDGKYFFFNRRQAWVTQDQTEIWWVDIRTILKPYVLNPAGESEAVAGEAITVTLPADEFGDLDDEKLSYTVSAVGGGPLPSWLTYDPAARALRGTPEAVGTVAIEITATDTLGSSCTDTLTIRVKGGRGNRG